MMLFRRTNTAGRTKALTEECARRVEKGQAGECFSGPNYYGWYVPVKWKRIKGGLKVVR